MATRIYLPGTASTPPISPTPDSAWEDTSILARVYGGTSKRGDTLATVAFTDANNQDRDILFRQYVIPLASGQTITGAQAIKFQCRVIETTTGNNMFSALGIRVVASDETTVRKTVLAVTRDAVEASATTLTNRQFTATSAAGNYTTVENDYLVIEIGMAGDPGGSSPHSSSMRLGDSAASDLSEDDTSTTDNNPWVQLNDTLTVGTIYGSGAAAGIGTAEGEGSYSIVSTPRLPSVLIGIQFPGVTGAVAHMFPVPTPPQQVDASGSADGTGSADGVAFGRETIFAPAPELIRGLTGRRIAARAKTSGLVGFAARPAADYQSGSGTCSGSGSAEAFAGYTFRRVQPFLGINFPGVSGALAFLFPVPTPSTAVSAYGSCAGVGDCSGTAEASEPSREVGLLFNDGYRRSSYRPHRAATITILAAFRRFQTGTQQEGSGTCSGIGSCSGEASSRETIVGPSPVIVKGRFGRRLLARAKATSLVGSVIRATVTNQSCSGTADGVGSCDGAGTGRETISAPTPIFIQGRTGRRIPARAKAVSFVGIAIQPVVTNQAGSGSADGTSDCSGTASSRETITAPAPIIIKGQTARRIAPRAKVAALVGTIIRMVSTNQSGSGSADGIGDCSGTGSGRETIAAPKPIAIIGRTDRRVAARRRVSALVGNLIRAVSVNQSGSGTANGTGSCSGEATSRESAPIRTPVVVQGIGARRTAYRPHRETTVVFLSKSFNTTISASGTADGSGTCSGSGTGTETAKLRPIGQVSRTKAVDRIRIHRAVSLWIHPRPLLDGSREGSGTAAGVGTCSGSAEQHIYAYGACAGQGSAIGICSSTGARLTVQVSSRVLGTVVVTGRHRTAISLSGGERTTVAVDRQELSNLGVSDTTETEVELEDSIF